LKGPGHRKSVISEATMNALCDAFLQLSSREECKRFLLDLCTPAEILAFTERWNVACLLDTGMTSYREICTKTGVSVTTIGRVARFLTQEPHQGYALVLKKMKEKSADHHFQAR
jgi:TrpR-related protein YerC/YecD